MSLLRRSYGSTTARTDTFGRLPGPLASLIHGQLGPEPATGLPEYVAHLAKQVADSVANASVLLVALDEEGLPLTSGGCRLSFRSDGCERERIRMIQGIISDATPESPWVDVPAELFQEPAAWRFHALSLRSGEHPCGILVLGRPSAFAERPRKTQVESYRPLLGIALQAALRAEGWRLTEDLQKLAQECFQQCEPEKTQWNLGSLVHKLVERLRVDAASIFLSEEGDLHLAASTDPQLGAQEQVLYRRGEGLTGWVFNRDQALRLRDTQNREEVRRVTGLERDGPRFPEHDSQGEVTGQFLGVPMHFGKEVVGVIRISRRQGDWWFSKSDEKALQFFGDLLGWGLARTWRLQLAASVEESIGECIAVSRRETTTTGSTTQRIVRANAGAERLLGRSRDELLGLEAREVYAPSDYEKIQQGLRQAIEDLKRGGRGDYGPVHCRLRRSDGTQVPVMISYRVLSNTLLKTPTFYTVGVARDVSESEQRAGQHQRFIELLDAMGIAYFRADENGKTLESTATDSALTGYSSEELKQLPREELYPDPDRRERLLREARKRQGQLTRVLLQLQRKGGERFWAEGDLRILKSPEGEETGLEGFYRDVTDRMRLQSFLNEDSERLLPDDELFARLKAEAEFHLNYLASIGHQIETPLSSLVGTLENFESGVMSQSELLQRMPWIIGQARVCSRLVRNLSYMDKILRGERFKKDNVSLAKLAIETKLNFRHLLMEKRLRLNIQDEGLDRHLQVWGHRELLRQVMVNLVDNAIKYSVKGSAISIRGYLWREGRVLEVSNRGFRISSQEREKIFQRGVRGRRAKAQVPHGTGLGLWLVRKILEAHNARIVCTEVTENGERRTVFRITFLHEQPQRSPRRKA